MHNDATLWKLIDGELPADEARALKDAAATDEALRRRIDEMRAMKDGILAGAPEPPPDFANRTVARVRASTGRVVHLETRLRRMTWMAAAASIFAVVAIGILTIGPLRAESPDLTRVDPVKRRLGDFVRKFPGLTTTQQRQIRTILVKLDQKKDGIRNQLDSSRLRQIQKAEDLARTALREVLSDEQRAEFDRGLDRK